MADEQRKPFYNKIFFCDVVGYSRLDPVGQFSCQRALNDGVRRALQTLSVGLGEDVIALPTGDGLILNFLHPATDAHLRTALIVLEHMEETANAEGSRFGLRVGLNSWTDTCVRDINGKLNVVGSGVNLAQRVMNIGKHAQIMMHDRVRDDLECYPEHANHVTRIGEFTVKHDLRVPIAQYVNPALSYVSAELAEVPELKAPNSFGLDDIMGDRAKAEVLRLHLDGRARSSMAAVQTFIEDYFDAHQVFQDRKVWASWIAGEMIENAFVHNPAAASEGIDLTIARSRDGMLISVLQPDVPGFELPAVLRDAAGHDSFTQLMDRRGVRWDVDRPGGHMRLWAELPDNISPESAAGLTLTLQPPEPAQLPHALLAFVDERTDDVLEGGVGFARASGHFGRVDEENWEDFHEWLTSKIRTWVNSAHTAVFDFSSVGYLSSRGLRSLTLAGRVAQEHGLKMAFIIKSPRLLEIMHLSRYDKMFGIFPDVPSAWERFKSS